MSGKTALGLAFAEKVSGIIIAIIGAILTYYTYTNTNVAGRAAGFFIGVGLALLVLGLILVVAKTG